VAAPTVAVFARLCGLSSRRVGRRERFPHLKGKKVRARATIREMHASKSFDDLDTNSRFFPDCSNTVPTAYFYNFGLEGRSTSQGIGRSSLGRTGPLWQSLRFLPD